MIRTVSNLSDRTKAILVFAAPAATAFLLIIGLLGVIYHESQARANERVRARTAFCEELEKIKRVQRQALTEKISESEKFLRDNPDGIPGIDDDLIRAGINRDKRTRLSLAPVSCEDFARVNDLTIDPKENP